MPVDLIRGLMTLFKSGGKGKSKEKGEEKASTFFLHVLSMNNFFIKPKFPTSEFLSLSLFRYFLSLSHFLLGDLVSD